MIREAIQQRLRALGLTQQQLAAASGVPQGKLSQFLAGKKEFTTETADAVLAALGLRIVAADEPLHQLADKPYQPDDAEQRHQE